MDIRLSPRPQRGFTLIELMITVAIVAILASIAYPLYTQAVTKSRRADAKTALLDLAQREERYMSTANSYTADATLLGFPANTKFPLDVLSGSRAFYTLTVVAPPGGGFSATAAPVVGSTQASDSCGSYTLTSAGAQSVSGNGGPSDCW